MRRDAGGHSNRDACCTVHQQVWDGRRKYAGFGQCAVKILDKIDRVLGDIRQHLHGRPRQSRLGITHGCRWVSIDAAEISLTFDQGVAHGEILRHAGHGIIDRHVPMRMVLAQYFTDDASGFFRRQVWTHAHVVHGIQDPPVNGFQPIAGVRQCPGDNHAHGIVEICLLHLFVNTNFLDQA